MSLKIGAVKVAAAAMLAMTAGALAQTGVAQSDTKRPAVNEGRPHKYYFSFQGKRRTFEEDGVENVEVVIPNDVSEGRYNVITADWNSDFRVPSHYHKTHSETFFVVAGQVEWTVEGETHVLNAGDALYIPPNTVHSIRVVGDQQMKSLMIYEPGGYEDQADFKMNYTAEELKDPKVIARIRAAGDFNLAEPLK